MMGLDMVSDRNIPRLAVIESADSNVVAVHLPLASVILHVVRVNHEFHVNFDRKRANSMLNDSICPFHYELQHLMVLVCTP